MTKIVIRVDSAVGKIDQEIVKVVLLRALGEFLAKRVPIHQFVASIVHSDNRPTTPAQKDILSTIVEEQVDACRLLMRNFHILQMEDMS